MISNKIFFLIGLFISAITFGQKNNLSPIFDISPDSRILALAISDGHNSDLYLFSLDGNKLTRLTNDKGYYSRPVFSPKGDRIIFLSKNPEAETSTLCSYNLSDKKIAKLTDDKTYVTEAAFMPDGNEIIYCGAGTITNYSPLARKAPHDIDLYSITVTGNKSRRLTNFSAYEFSSITPNKTGDAILCKLITKGAEGIYLLSLADNVKTKIEASNNPIPEIGNSFYDTPVFAKNNTQICFTAPYQLYLMNLSDKKCIEIWSTFGKEKQAMPIFAKFDGTDQKVLFSVLAIANRQYSRSAQFFSFDLTTKTLIPIPIPIGD